MDTLTPVVLGNLFQHKVRFFLPEIIGTAVSTGGAITAWQAQAQWLVSILAGCAGFVAGVLTIRSLLKKERDLKKS